VPLLFPALGVGFLTANWLIASFLEDASTNPENPALIASASRGS
jgi:hypothetical protein